MLYISRVFCFFWGGGRIDNLEYEIELILNKPIETNITYPLTNFLDNQAEYITKEENIICYYDFENTFSGKVNFSKIDRINFIISGKFEFSTVTQDCDTIRITDGRFDMQYIP